ncbi:MULTISPECIES: ATP-binding protein [unclassified Roseitalea]|uniref:ATP-binding response regulator n=1 Tax=unclassified Roseitalea TaxID=2639107 RepID=UPI00273FFD9C|nr:MULTISPECIES: ATP-binding protein [unclassified Roseitalea]
MNFFVNMINRWTEALTPDHLRADMKVYKRVRMFIISHLFGPFLGHPITIYLFLNDPAPWPHVHILGLSVTLFWFFPLALQFFPRRYELLAITSVLNLNFAILLTSYHFGGVSSPLLMWFLVVPLLAFFYLGSGLRTSLAIFAQIIIGLAVFYAFYLANKSFPQHIPLEDMVDVTMISMLCATLYIFFMASYYTSVVDSQSELLKEIERHQSTLDDLKQAKDEADRARDEAERANGAKSEFLAKMSHELRTPLNAVLGYSEILLEDAELDGNGEQIADLEKISAAGKHLLSMVNDILDISKIEAGKTELYLEDVNIDDLISEIEITARPLAAKNTNVFEVIKPERIGEAHLDLTKLRQAIFNLLSNAAKFCQNGKITVEVARFEDQGGRQMLSIAVHDTGVGISEEALGSLFQSFTQAHASINAKFGGTGLGLSLSKNLCRLMGGDIQAESTLGEGSTFTITVPVMVTQASAEMDHEQVDETLREAASDLRRLRDAESGLAASAPIPVTSKGTVLVVDDDPEYLELMDRLLRKEDFVPVLTTDPGSALQLARTIKPMLMLIDVLMPDVDGWEVVRSLKSDPSTAHVPVVMVSIMDDPKADAPQSVDGFISKPVDTAKLRRILRAHLSDVAA